MSKTLAVIDHGSEWAVVSYFDASEVWFVGSFAECEALAGSTEAWTFGFNEAVKRAANLISPGERPAWGMEDGNRDDVAELAGWIALNDARQAVMALRIEIKEGK